MRDIVKGLLYITKTNCQWDYVPKDYPPITTLFYYFRIQTLDGTWKKIHNFLRRFLRVMYSRNPELSAGILNNQSVKTTGLAFDIGLVVYIKTKTIGHFKVQCLLCSIAAMLQTRRLEVS